MAGEAGINDGSLYPLIIHNVEHFGYEITRAPHPRATRLHDDFEPRIAAAEITKETDKMIHVITLACHQMSTTEIHPFQLLEIPSELTFKRCEHLFKIIA